jgi:hypothetical protein
MTHRCRRAYDHRVREQVVRSGNPDLFPELEIPRRTALSWLRRGLGDVVTLDHEDWHRAMCVRVANLQRRVAMLAAVMQLLVTLLRVSGFELERARNCPGLVDRDSVTQLETWTIQARSRWVIGS